MRKRRRNIGVRMAASSCPFQTVLVLVLDLVVANNSVISVSTVGAIILIFNMWEGKED